MSQSYTIKANYCYHLPNHRSILEQRKLRYQIGQYLIGHQLLGSQLKMTDSEENSRLVFPHQVRTLLDDLKTVLEKLDSPSTNDHMTEPICNGYVEKLKKTEKFEDFRQLISNTLFAECSELLSQGIISSRHVLLY